VCQLSEILRRSATSSPEFFSDLHGKEADPGPIYLQVGGSEATVERRKSSCLSAIDVATRGGF
jgi:hypothetical protein